MIAGGGSGSFWPTGPQTGIPAEAFTSFRVMAASGFELDDWSASGVEVCLGSFNADQTVFTTGSISEDCTYTFTFKAIGDAPVVTPGEVTPVPTLGEWALLLLGLLMASLGLRRLGGGRPH